MRGRDVEAEIALHSRKHIVVGRAASTFPQLNRVQIAEGAAQRREDLSHLSWHGHYSPPETLDVTIPAGIREGSVIRLAGQGEPGRIARLPGDLFLRVGIARIACSTVLARMMFRWSYRSRPGRPHLEQSHCSNSQRPCRDEDTCRRGGRPEA